MRAVFRNHPLVFLFLICNDLGTFKLRYPFKMALKLYGNLLTLLFPVFCFFVNVWDLCCTDNFDQKTSLCNKVNFKGSLDEELAKKEISE